MHQWVDLPPPEALAPVHCPPRAQPFGGQCPGQEEDCTEASRSQPPRSIRAAAWQEGSRGRVGPGQRGLLLCFLRGLSMTCCSHMQPAESREWEAQATENSMVEPELRSRPSDPSPLSLP